MDAIKGDLQGVFIYLDDIFIASATEKELSSSQGLVQCLASFRLMVNRNEWVLGACKFSWPHSVSGIGIRPLKGKMQAI